MASKSKPSAVLLIDPKLKAQTNVVFWVLAMITCTFYIYGANLVSKPDSCCKVGVGFSFFLFSVT